MRIISIFAVVLAAGLCGCNSDSDKTEVVEIYIDHYKSECLGPELSLCMRSRLSADDEWALLYGSIGGFEYEWGYNYKLKVIAQDIENPPEDTPAKKYVLLEILSKELELADTVFELSASRAPGLVVTNKSPNICEIYGEKEFSCSAHQSLLISSLLVEII